MRQVKAQTTPNTEPIPATDAEISGIAAWNCDCRFQAGKDRHTRECLMVFGPRLIARIEQEREMRRELTKVLEAVNAAIAFGLLAELRLYHRAWQGLNDSVMAALARAAKMEADNAR